MKIKHVYQLDDTGCGIACVSMLINKSYNYVKEIMLQKGTFNISHDNLSTTFAELTNTLDLFNIKVERKRKFKTWKNIPAKIAIASTNYDKSGCWYWVIFVRDLKGYFIYDPGKKRKKIRDLRGKMVGWFIEINEF